MFYLKIKLFNFLATRIGAALAPVLIAFLTGVITYICSRVPWLKGLVTYDNISILFGFLLSAGLAYVNYLTTSRAFKYAEPLQKFLNILAEDMNLPQIKVDGVAASETVSLSARIAHTINSEKATQIKYDHN